MSKEPDKLQAHPGIQCPFCQAVFTNPDLYKEHIEMELDD